MAGSIKELSGLKFCGPKLFLEARFIFMILAEPNHLREGITQ